MTQLEERDLYKVSYWEVFQRNFLVGFSRALGGLIVQIIFFAFIYFSIMQLVWPRFEPIFRNLPFGQRSNSTENQGSQFNRNFTLF